MAVTILDALHASAVLDESNPAHAADVAEVMSRSALRGDVAIIDGSLSGPAIASAAAKVLLDTLEVEFSHLLGSGVSSSTFAAALAIAGPPMRDPSTIARSPRRADRDMTSATSAA